MAEKYRIELTRKQIQVIADALELSSRMRCGQIEVRYMKPIDDELVKNQGYEGRDMADVIISQLKNFVWPELTGGNGHSHGIGYDTKSDHEYEMYKEILYTFEKERQAEAELNKERYFSNVHSSSPHRLTDNPPIKITPLTKDILREENIDDLLQE